MEILGKFDKNSKVAIKVAFFISLECTRCEQSKYENLRGGVSPSPAGQVNVVKELRLREPTSYSQLVKFNKPWKVIDLTKQQLRIRFPSQIRSIARYD